MLITAITQAQVKTSTKPISKSKSKKVLIDVKLYSVPIREFYNSIWSNNENELNKSSKINNVDSFLIELFDKIKNNKIKIYDNYLKNSSHLISPKEFRMMTTKIDSNFVIKKSYPIPHDSTIVKITELDIKDIYEIKYMEAWYYDSETMMIEK